MRGGSVGAWGKLDNAAMFQGADSSHSSQLLPCGNSSILLSETSTARDYLEIWMLYEIGILMMANTSN